MTRRFASVVIALLASGVLGTAIWMHPGGTRVSVVAADSPLSAESAADSLAPTSLSPYWSPKILRWSALIVQEAARRQLDPDLLASLVWIESRGDPEAIGPAGATGLMQIMPKEAGFSWRPARDALLDPAMNLFWGTRTLATVINQGDGDVFSALAAYNGGWNKVANRRPQLFATIVLRDYAKALVAHHQLAGAWTAVVAVVDSTVHGPIRIIDSTRDDAYLYGYENVTPEGGPLVPAIPPTSVVYRCDGEEDRGPFYVGVWLFDVAEGRWVTGDALPEPTPIPTPEPSVAETGDGAVDEPRGAPPVLSASGDPNDGEADVQAADTQDAGAQNVLAPTNSPAEVPVTPVAMPSFTCSGGPLVLDAYPLERVNTIEGWKARVYAGGRGGDCVYTYAWNDETDVRAENVRGAVTFEVSSSRRGEVIVGTVVLSSAGETVRVGVYIHPPAP